LIVHAQSMKKIIWQRYSFLAQCSEKLSFDIRSENYWQSEIVWNDYFYYNCI